MSKKAHDKIAKGLTEALAIAKCDHQWSSWRIIGHTGDWFHPHIVERKCELCGAKETDEH